jgi:hypothetical protein
MTREGVAGTLASDDSPFAKSLGKILADRPSRGAACLEATTTWR